MPMTKTPVSNSPFTTKLLTVEHKSKIQRFLINHVYHQGWVGLASSLFCAAIIFVSQFNASKDNMVLYLWASFLISITCIRMTLMLAKKISSNESILLWRALYTFGTFLGGCSWGLASLMLLPYSTDLQQMILILMLAGVTAGAIPLSAGILEASILFLIASIVPFIAVIATFNDEMWMLFNVALSIYLVYTLVLSTKTHTILRNSVFLTFENDALLKNLELTNTKLHQASTHDALTGLPNRRYFETKIKRTLEKAKINNMFAALLYIDLDHFKEANDLYGHHAGDAILLTVTQRLIDYLRSEDQIARIGGDELIVIIENITPQTIPRIKEIAKRICHLIAIPIPHGDITLKVSASIGISIYPIDGTDEFLLLKTADKLMYKVKKSGGNNYAIGSEETFLSY